MRYVWIFVAVALLVAPVSAQVFIPDNNASGARNVIPFGGAWPSSSNPNGEFTYQWFIPSSLMVLPGKTTPEPFRITGIADFPCYTGVHTASDAEITIGHTTLTAPSTTFAQNLPNPVTLRPTGSAWTWNVTANTFSPFPLTQGAFFDYNGKDNLVIQIRLNGAKSSVQGTTYLSCWNSSARNGATRVYRYGTGAFTATTASSSTPGYSDKLRLTVLQVAIAGSGTPRPGGTVDLDLVAPSDAGLPYQVASSLGTGPTPIGTRSIGISVDNVFGASVSGLLTAIFKDYSGLLDGNGKAKAQLILPSITQLVGVRIHSAFVTVKSGEPENIKSISGTYSFTVQQ